MREEQGVRRRGLGLLVLAVVPVFALSCVSTARAQDASPSPSPPASGAQVFTEICSGCHGPQGQGNPQGPFYGPSLRGAGFPSLVAVMVERGRRSPVPPHVQMPAFVNVLTSAQITAVADYVAQQISDPASRTAVTSDGGVLFRLYCSGCHSAAGRGGAIMSGLNAADLRVLPPATVLAAVIIGPGNMPVFAENTFDVREQTAVARYVEAITTQPSVGGSDLDAIGPVAEGFAAAVALAVLVLFTVWLAWGHSRGRPRG
jgi:ubiquinol-cytochrome c reductase cytochrome c subunit